ncbi:MAG TPA: hypothetical protein VJX70_11330 [Candidatus Acidoferrum sp.]|nr:hypothetical protein [Candidatus Acidoferrum sp.]
MKNQFLILKSVLSVSLILLSVAAPVNHRFATRSGMGNAQVADGVPLPVPTTPPPKVNVLVADGVPLPVPTTPPPKMNSLVADGVPLPVPTTPPPKLSA